jgi:hypothetical protein
VASTTNKKVLIYRFDRAPVAGFVQTNAWLKPDGIELLTQSGVVTTLPWNEAKMMHFVRDFTSDPLAGARRAFLSRPKLDGLWVRLAFRDGESLEGVMPNNLLFMETEGVHIIPPDSAQRVFVPRSALTSVTVLGVVGSPLRAGKSKKAGEGKTQIGLFEGPAG